MLIEPTRLLTKEMPIWLFAWMLFGQHQLRAENDALIVVLVVISVGVVPVNVLSSGGSDAPGDVLLVICRLRVGRRVGHDIDRFAIGFVGSNEFGN